jgi:acyl carrier protein
MKQELCKFIVDNYLYDHRVDFSDDDSFQEKGIIDSTGVLELVSFLEKSYGVRIEDDELVPENLDSINRLLRFLDGKLQSAGLPEEKIAVLTVPENAVEPAASGTPTDIGALARIAGA